MPMFNEIPLEMFYFICNKNLILLKLNSVIMLHAILNGQNNNKYKFLINLKNKFKKCL